MPTETAAAPTVPTVAPPTPTASAAAAEPAGLDISPADIRLDTQGLPYSWQPVVVPLQPYDASSPPGPTGMPEHIEILFGVTDPKDRQPNDPVMYIIPVDAYRQLWSDAGNDSVAKTIDLIFQFTVALQNPPPTSGFPVLPYEFGGVNDLAVQQGRVPADAASASINGYRFVGRWAQDANPVTNQGLHYVYQGFTNDGKYLVSFFYPVRTDELPDEVSQVPADEMQEFNADPTAAIQAKAVELNQLATSDWEPDLATLDKLVASLQIAGMPANGLVEQRVARRLPQRQARRGGAAHSRSLQVQPDVPPGWHAVLRRGLQ